MGKLKVCTNTFQIVLLRNSSCEGIQNFPCTQSLSHTPLPRVVSVQLCSRAFRQMENALRQYSPRTGTFHLLRHIDGPKKQPKEDSVVASAEVCQPLLNVASRACIEHNLSRS